MIMGNHKFCSHIYDATNWTLYKKEREPGGRERERKAEEAKRADGDVIGMLSLGDLTWGNAT